MSSKLNLGTANSPLLSANLLNGLVDIGGQKGLLGSVAGKGPLGNLIGRR